MDFTGLSLLLFAPKHLRFFIVAPGHLRYYKFRIVIPHDHGSNAELHRGLRGTGGRGTSACWVVSNTSFFYGVSRRKRRRLSVLP